MNTDKDHGPSKLAEASSYQDSAEEDVTSAHPVDPPPYQRHPPKHWPPRYLLKLFRPIWRMRRGMTLGAQGVIIDESDRVLLVRHTYRPNWFFPGGGVEWNETLERALHREMEEEVGVVLAAQPKLHGVFANFASFPGDHIAVFIVREWTRRGTYFQVREIADAIMADRHHLPPDIDPGTGRRVAEIFGGAPVSGYW